MRNLDPKKLRGMKRQSKYLKGLRTAAFKGKDFAVALTFALMVVFGRATAFAETTPALSLNFNMTEMFSWTQMILDVMLPVLYITLGVSLAFIIIRALKQAFN